MKNQVLGFIARTIRFADEHALEPDHVIALSLENGRRFRVMAGRVSALSTWKGGLYVEMDRATLGEDPFARLAEGRLIEQHGISSTPASVGVRLEFSEVAELEPAVRPAHEAFMRHSLALGRSQHWNKQEPELLALLRRGVVAAATGPPTGRPAEPAASRPLPRPTARSPEPADSAAGPRRLRIASWNMAHWQYSRKVSNHTGRVWGYLADRGIDVALAQEAVAPPRELGWRHQVPECGWRIGDTRQWGSGVGTRRLEAAEVRSAVTRYGAHEFDLLPPTNYRGAVAIADVEVPPFGTITMISVYAAMVPVYAQTTVFRVVADLIPLFDGPRKGGRRHFILGGDLNAHTQTRDQPELTRYGAILQAVESLGLVNCFKATAGQRPELAGCTCRELECYHVQTRRNPRHRGTPKEHYSGHFDYLFASPDLAERLDRCYAIGAEDESVWELSDHCPVVAEFDLTRA